MTYTKEEARKKLCPEGPKPAAHGPDDWTQRALVYTCQPEDCLGWRWDGDRGFCGVAGRP